MKAREETETPKDVSLADLAEAIKAAMPVLDETDQHIATAIHRLMSSGAPVEPAAIANAAGGVSLERVNERLNTWPGVFRDDMGRVVGFWGHAIDKLEPEYRLVAAGNTTYAWCTLDTLFIPGIIGDEVRVEASDPLSGEPVSLVVDRDGACTTVDERPVRTWIDWLRRRPHRRRPSHLSFKASALWRSRMKITIQYFDGCPHWRLADERVRHVLRDSSGDDVTLEYQFIDSPETADQLGFHGSPTILIDGWDPFITGVEQVGMSCRVFRTEDGIQGAPTEAELRKLLLNRRPS